MTSDERQKMYFPMFGVAVALLIMNVGYYAHDVIVPPGTAYEGIRGNLAWLLDYFINDWAAKMNAYSSQYTLKALILFCLVLMQMLKAGKSIDLPWKRLWTYLAVGLGIFLFPLLGSEFKAAQYIYLTTTVVGFVLTGHAVALLGRKINGLDDDLNDRNETFDQCRALIDTDDSFNLETRFRWKHKTHKGWINVVNPFRAAMVLGTPGSGKSYSVFNPIIEQGIKKGYTMFCYDYKYPTLTKIVMNTLEENQEVFRKKYGREAKFCVINFNDPRNSMRCNPIHPRYIHDTADCTEIADIIMRNINPQSIEREDFFSMSAKVYIAGLIAFLWLYKGGRYCAFPYLIELMGCDYKDVFNIIEQYDEVKIMMKPFQNALKDKAMEQLQGQLASAQIPLLKFASPALYWVLSGDDFPLDLNNPDHPEVICIGNDPDRQTIYGTTLALFTSRMFREINKEGKLKSLVLFDELPTVYLKGLDNLIATARSNRVAIMLGAQDESQLIRDYTDKEAKVIFNTIGNKFSGQVNGETARNSAASFGREFRQQQSQTTGGENDTVNTSYHQQDILTQTRIETLPQGMFFGKVADDASVVNSDELTRYQKKEFEKKLFCSYIKIDNEAFAARKKNWRDVTIDIPMFASLDRETEERVLADKKGSTVAYLLHNIKEEHNDTDADDSKYMWQAEEAYNALPQAEKDAMLKKVTEQAKQDALHDMVMKNYYRIISDVKGIIDEEKTRVANDYRKNKRDQSADTGADTQSEEPEPEPESANDTSDTVSSSMEPQEDDGWRND